MKRWMMFLPLALALVALPAFSQTVVLQQGVDGYEGTQDSHIISWDGNQNQLQRNADGSNGGNLSGTPTTGGNPQNPGGHVFIEEGDYGNPGPLFDDSKVILIQFDLSGVTGDPSGAQLGLYYWYERNQGDAAQEGSGRANPHTLYVNRILKAWDEGPGDGSSGVDGDDTPDNSGAVTWNSTGFELWQAMGAEGPEDIAPTEDAVFFDPGVGGWVWFDVTTSAKLWLSDPSTNHGVKISQEQYPTDPNEPDLDLGGGVMVYSAGPTDHPTGFVGGAYNFVSSENTDHPDLRPKLVLQFGGDGKTSNTLDWELIK